MEIRVAVSTEDGVTLTPDHFGEGRYFLIYEFSNGAYRLVERRENTSPEEEDHGSAEKAKSISAILRDIPVLLGYQFGPNIMRIKDHFLPVVSRERNIERALELLSQHFEVVESELGQKRGNVVILNDHGARIVKVKDSNAKDF